MLLGPDIQEALLQGRQMKGVQLEEVTRAMPSAWEEQRDIINWNQPPPAAGFPLTRLT
jgi:hypothetical protein